MLSQATFAMTVPSMLVLVTVAVLLVGLIAWLLPRPDASLSVRHLGDDGADRRPSG